MKYLLLPIIFFLSCCHLSLPYEDDVTYMSSGKANYPTFYVLFNNHPCKDSQGIPGMCIFKHREDMPIQIKILPQTYSYTLNFRCGNSSGIFFRKDMDVVGGLEFEVIGFENQSYFNCIGDIFPKDRDTDVSAFFEMRIRLYKSGYTTPTEIYITPHEGKSYLVLGSSAYSSKIKIGSKWLYLKKKTTLLVTDPIEFAMTETYNMRRSYFGKF